MPCNDITDTIRIRLDSADRLLSYTLNKKTCGGGVGAASLLENRVHGRTVEDLLGLSADDLVPPDSGMEEAEEFLTLKHFFALQIALEVLTGRAPGGVADQCVVARVTQEGDELVFEADLPIDLPTERIRSCGRCKGCPSVKTSS